MKLSDAALISLGVLGCVVTGSAEAQEYGVVVGSVTPGVGAAARSLGAASTSAITRAAQEIAAVNQGTGASGQNSSGIRSGPTRIDVQRFTGLPAGDPLDGTDAPTYALGNGRTIRTSGGFMPAAEPFARIKWCVLEYGSVAATGGLNPSGPPHDDCRNVRS